MLSKRDAKLRATALRGIGAASLRLTGMGGRADALLLAMYNRPRSALRRIAFAERALAEAKRALRAWSRSRA